MKYPIRVLCVFATLGRGGAESMCMNLYRHIDRSKVQFDFVKHTHEKGAFEDEILSLGGFIFEAPRFREYNRISYKKWWVSFLKQHDEYQIIHGHYFTISDVYLSIAKKMGLACIAHIHCTSPKSQNILKSAKLLLMRHHIHNIFKYADYRLACSGDAGKWGYGLNSYTVLNNAIDTSQYQFNSKTRMELREKLDIVDCFVVGAVGRISTQKNPFGIVDIFCEICKKRDDARLLWIGTYDSNLGKQTMDYAKKMGVYDKILFTGVVSNVNEMMQAMDCFIFPSLYEGLGMVAIEAQAAGLQCFLSDTIPQEVCITDNCTMLPLNNPKLWSEKILISNLDRKDTQQQIIEAGYDTHTTVEWLQNFYLSIDR